MNNEKNKPLPDNQQEKQRKQEQAINHMATNGENVNDQVEQKREKHQPRDTA